MSVPDDDYLEEGFKDILMTIKRSFTQEGRNRNQVEKVLNKSRQEMKKRVKEASLEQLKEYSENLKNSIEHNRELLETEDDRVIKAAMQDHNKWLENLLNEVESKITKSQESFEIYVDEYLEEGLFSKKPKVEVEVIYGDWEADCTVWEVGNDMKPIDDINISLPEKFHSGSNDNWDENLAKGEWERIFLDYVKKAIAPKLKKYNVTRIFLH